MVYFQILTANSLWTVEECILVEKFVHYYCQHLALKCSFIAEMVHNSTDRHKLTGIKTQWILLTQSSKAYAILFVTARTALLFNGIMTMMFASMKQKASIILQGIKKELCTKGKKLTEICHELVAVYNENTMTWK